MDTYYNQINSNIRKGKYKLLGSGSGRRVYDLGNGYVVKVAKNRKGIAQNKTEYEISSNDPSDVFARVKAMSDDSIFLVMEKAQRLKDLSYVRQYYHVYNNRQLFQINELRDFYVYNDLLVPDLYRCVNWGMIDGKPVIIDYGFTKNVRRKYYSMF
nr:hypothetical protein [Anaeromicropila herbilytica]